MKEPTYDPSREWDRYCEEEERWLARRQRCSKCEEPIADDFCYCIDGEYLCEECSDELYKVGTPETKEEDYCYEDDDF